MEQLIRQNQNLIENQNKLLAQLAIQNQQLLNMTSNGMIAPENVSQETIMTKRERVFAKYGEQISQLPNGRYYIRLEDGYLIQRKSPERVVDKIIEHLSELKEKSEVRTLESEYNDFVKYRHNKDRRSTTYAKDDDIWNTYYKDSSLVKIPLNNITRHDIITHMDNVVCSYNNDPNHLARNMVMSTKNFANIRGYLNKFFNFLVNKELMESNKLSGMEFDGLKKGKPKKRGEDVFNTAEEKQILQAIDTYTSENHSTEALGISIIFRTGVRVGELCALKWADIDNKILYVHSQNLLNMEETDFGYVRAGFETVGDTKSEDGTREINLPSKAVTDFALIKKINSDNGFGTEPDDYVFQRNNRYTNFEDAPMTDRVFDNCLRRMCKKCGLAFEKSCHDIRRTYISKLLASGMDIDEVRRIAGHSDIKMTMRYDRGTATKEQLQESIENIFRD